MKNLTLKINNPNIENMLYILSEAQNKSIEIIAINLLQQIANSIKINKPIELDYNILNPDKYITKINYNLEDDKEEQTVFPFEHVKNSTE